MLFLDTLIIFLKKFIIIVVIVSIFNVEIDAMEENTEMDITERVERHFLLPKSSVVQTDLATN